MVFAKDTRGSIKTYAHRLVNGQAGSSLAPLLVQPETLQVQHLLAEPQNRQTATTLLRDDHTLQHLWLHIPAICYFNRNSTGCCCPVISQR